MKSEMSIFHRFPSLNFLPLHSSGIYYLLCIFCLPKINKKNKNRNAKVCLTLPLSKNYCIYKTFNPFALQVSGLVLIQNEPPVKRNFWINYSTHAKYNVQISQSIVSFIITILNNNLF